jgi:hypothetical protein
VRRSSENELSDSVEDNALFERRAGGGLQQSLVGASSGGFERAGEDGGETVDGATVPPFSTAHWRPARRLASPARVGEPAGPQPRGAR